MKNLLLLLLLCVMATATAFAQVTTSSLTGAVKDASGSPSIGATVQAKHEPTGTVYGVAANSEGRYTIQNMRVGGPYTVTISFIGARTETFNNITLQLGQPSVLNATLQVEGTALSEVTVTAPNSRSVLNADRNGAVTNVDRTQIQRLPSITRSLNDFTRLTPQATSTSQGAIGGGNFRQNQITVDGADFNNNFGIGGNLPANGSPISLDAIEEVSINVTPYDVRQSGFIGSAVNAVTRAGTNEVSGSVYTYFRNQNQVGTRVGADRLTLTDQKFNQYGIRLGGPIIKNKLFFFANYETEKRTTPGQQRIAATPNDIYGGGNANVTRPQAADLDRYSTFLKETYGYDPGPYQGYGFDANQTKILGRIDWNISNNHRFNIRYSQVEGKSPSFVSTSSSPLSNYSTGIGRTDINALPFGYTNYYQESNFYSLAAELNSTFGGGKYANTLRGTYTRQNDPRSSDSQIFPFVDILDGSGPRTYTTTSTPLTSFGYEPFTYGNLRDVEIYSFKDDFNWTLGRHNITIGAQVDLSTTKNGFQRFGTSYYRFNSWSDFTTGQRPVAFAQTYSLAPNFEQAFPTFKFGQYALYAQDEIAVTSRLRVTPGLRVDLTTFPEPLAEHPLINALTFANGEKINVANLPESKLLYSPRVGFNWDAKGDRSLQVRGGTGIFSGKIPYVWIVSQAGDAGLLQVTETAFLTATTTTPGPFNPNPNAYRPATVPVAGTVIPNPISAIARDFKFPQTWKSSLAVDAKLPGGIVGTLEGIYNKDLNTALFRNANLVEGQRLNGNGPDNRIIYPNANQDKFINPIIGGKAVANGTPSGGAFNAIVLDNASKGYYWSVTGKLDKQFNRNFFASVAYTHSEAENLYDGGGDQPLSAWQGTASVNGANNPNLGYASYIVPDRVVASLSYRQEYLNHLGTTISVFLEGSSGGRFSYLYNGDLNRDGANADLIYIPKNPSEIEFSTLTIPANASTGTPAITYTPQQQKDLFFRYIEQDKYLSQHKGEYAKRNGALLPWRNQVDVKFLQDIFTNIGKDKRNTLQFSWDIFNIGNLINSNWGLLQTSNAASILTPTNAATLNPGRAPIPTYTLALDRGVPAISTFRNSLTAGGSSSNGSGGSTYYMQFGLRYIFN